MKGAQPPLKIDQPAAYRIRVQGWVGAGWEDWFEGMRLAHEEPAGEGAGDPPVTTLSGVLPDQAALLGLLQRLYAFGLPILSVECIDS